MACVDKDTCMFRPAAAAAPEQAARRLEQRCARKFPCPRMGGIAEWRRCYRHYAKQRAADDDLVSLDDLEACNNHHVARLVPAGSAPENDDDTEVETTTASELRDLMEKRAGDLRRRRDRERNQWMRVPPPAPPPAPPRDMWLTLGAMLGRMSQLPAAVLDYLEGPREADRETEEGSVRAALLDPSPRNDPLRQRLVSVWLSSAT